MAEDREHGEKPRRRPVQGRARTRAVRAWAALTGVSYSVARRQLSAFPERTAGQGRTVYPASSDIHRRMLIDCRAQRTFQERVHDARVAADLPRGRARHLAERFPPTRGEQGTGVGPLYHGEGRQEVLALVYAMIAAETGELVPSVGELAWAAELGQETAVDIVCSLLDRTARLMLDRDRAILRRWAVDAQAASRAAGRPATRDHAERLAALAALRHWDTLPFGGAKQILDALLVVAEDGHAPGTRVIIGAAPYTGMPGTIIGARWELSGPPRAYDVHPDGGAASIIANPDDLVLLSEREA